MFSASLHALVMCYYDTPTSEFAFDELIWIESGSNPPPDVDQVDRDRFDVDSSADRIDVDRIRIRCGSVCKCGQALRVLDSSIERIALKSFES